MEAENHANPSHPFSADRPITNSQSDVLGRGRFASALAQSIASWRGQDSLVVALYGAYGAGKTSVKNLVIEELPNRTGPSPTVIEFNPWQFAAQATIVESFFDEVGRAIGKGSLASGKDRKKLLERWERYSGYVKGTAGIVESLRKPFALLLSAATVLLLLGVYLKIFIWILVVLSVLAALSLWISGLFDHILGVVRAHSLHIGTTLEDAKRTLAESVNALKSPVVIVLDDLDRLTPAQLLEVFQLVKANGDFANLVYLLLFDPAVVAKHISEVLKTNGQEYLEKIVQVGFDLPQASTKNVQDVLFSRLNTVLGQAVDWSRFDQNRWGNIFYGGLQFYFNNLRDVNRFASTLSFHFAGFRGKDAFEVNPIDLIALEAIRVFDPRLYSTLPPNKKVLTRTRSAEGSERVSDRTAVENVLSPEAENERGWKQELLGQLFPNAAWAFDRPNYHSAGDPDAWIRELRACAASMFDRYFGFAIPEGELSQGDIEQLLSVGSDRDILSNRLKELSDAGLLDAALERLAAYRRKLPVEHTIPFLTALFDISDQLHSGVSGFGFMSPQMRASLISHGYLKSDPDVKRRTNHLKQAIENTSGVALPALLILMEDQSARQQNLTEMLIDVSDLEELKAICANKIAIAAADGRLFRLPSAAFLLYRWQEWGSSEKLKVFMASHLSQGKNVLAFLKAFVHTALSSGSGDYIGREHTYINLSDVERFANLDLIRAPLQNLNPEELSKEEQDSILLFRKAEQRRAQGKSDFGASPIDLLSEN
jgi:predicted KAP-like P-loop ATPase